MTVDLEFSLFWDESPDLWDTVYLAGDAMPGVASVSASHGRKLDVKSAPGSNGARIVDKGYEPAKVEITLKLWTKEQLMAWYRIAPTLTYRREPPTTRSEGATRPAVPTPKAIAAKSEQNAQAKLREKETIAPRPTRRSTRAGRLERHDVEIGHPALDTIQVHRVYIQEVTAPSGSGGVYEVKIKAIESRVPRSVGTRSVTRTDTGQAGLQTTFTDTPSGSGGSAP
jgi:hypothetical protein